MSSTERSPPNSNRCRCLLWCPLRCFRFFQTLITSSFSCLHSSHSAPLRNPHRSSTNPLHQPTPAPEAPRLRVKTPQKYAHFPSNTQYLVRISLQTEQVLPVRLARLSSAHHSVRPSCNQSLLFHFLVGAILIFEGSSFVAAGAVSARRESRSTAPHCVIIIVSVSLRKSVAKLPNDGVRLLQMSLAVCELVSSRY